MQRASITVPSVVNQHRSLTTRIVEPLAPRACATVPTCHLPDPSLWAAAELASRAAEGRAVRPTSYSRKLLRTVERPTRHWLRGYHTNLQWRDTLLSFLDIDTDSSCSESLGGSEVVRCVVCAPFLRPSDAGVRLRADVQRLTLSDFASAHEMRARATWQVPAQSWRQEV